MSTDPRTVDSCYLTIANGNEYPENHYQPSIEPTRLFRDV